MLKSQDIRAIVRLTSDTTVLDLSQILNWTPARTQKTIYLNGGGILSNTSIVDFNTARRMIQQAGREAAQADQQIQVHCMDDADVKDNIQSHLWEQRIKYWLTEAVELFSLPNRLSLETALVLTDMAVTQLILGSTYATPAVDTTEPFLEVEGGTPRFEWHDILSKFRVPSGGAPDAIEMAFLNDLHAARNDVIHTLAPFLLDRDNVYIWLFLALSFAAQWNVAPDQSTTGITNFLPALNAAGEADRERCVHWLNQFIPALLESALGPIQGQVNLDGSLGITDEPGRAFCPDLVITDQEGQRYSAQVEIPRTLNIITAQWWGYFQPSLVFVPLGYLARARYLAKLSNYPDDRLIPYLSPVPDSNRGGI